MKKLFSYLALLVIAFAVPGTALAWNYNGNSDPKKIVLHFNNNIGGDREMTYTSDDGGYWYFDFISAGEAANFTVRSYYNNNDYHEYYDDEGTGVGDWSADCNNPQVSNTSFWVNKMSQNKSYRLELKGADTDANQFKFRVVSSEDPWQFDKNAKPSSIQVGITNGGSGLYGFTFDDSRGEYKWRSAKVSTQSNTDWFNFKFIISDGSEYITLGKNVGATSVNTVTVASVYDGETETYYQSGLSRSTDYYFEIAANGDNNFKFRVVPASMYDTDEDEAYMPLTKSDFANGKKHYFFVGTRTGDWSLQPEWELTVNGDEAVLDDRIFYSGLCGIAVVDNYYDYTHQMYTLYTSNNTYYIHPGFTNSDLAGNLSNCGTFIARNIKDATFTADNRTLFNTIILNTNGYNHFVDDDILKGPAYQGNIVVKLSDGVPTAFGIKDFKEAAFSDRVFTLVGSKIYMQGDEGATKTRGDVYGAYTGKGWQEGWIQYDGNGKYYYDAYKNPIYQTVWQNSWLKNHKSYFNVNMDNDDETDDFHYSSDEITFVEASQLDKLESDPYRTLYNRFTSGGSKQIGNGNTTSINADKANHVTNNGLDYYEVIDIWYRDNQNCTSDNWQCFVVKDMWMEGTFKVWSGWGGNTKRNEAGTDAKTEDSWKNAARWYYDNGGHGQEKNNHVVNGYDYKEATAADNSVMVYGTTRDKDGADFALNNRTYFKRVLLWFDPADGFDNSVIQLIIEKYGPNIQAFRTNKNHLNYKWTVPYGDQYGDGEGEDAKLASYTVIRYCTTNSDDQGTVVEENVALNDKLVKDLGTLSFNDPATLAPGEYRYEIVLTFTNGAVRDALSNHVTIYQEKVPVTATACQRIEEGPLYSFDVQLNINTTEEFLDRKVTIDNVEYNMADKVSKYVIFADEATAAELNKATAGDKFAENTTGYYIYSGDMDNPTVKTGWLITKDFDTETPSIDLQWDNVDPTKTYSFEVYLVSDEDQQKWAEQFCSLNYNVAYASTNLYVPTYTVALKNGGLDTWEDVSAMTTPVSQMPVGARMKGETEAAVAPIHFQYANRVYFDMTTTALPVTESVKSNWTVAKTVNFGNFQIALDGADATDGTFKRAPFAYNTDVELPDGTTGNSLTADGAKFSCTANATYLKDDVANVSVDANSANITVKLPTFAAPLLTPEKVFLAVVKHEEGTQNSLDAIISTQASISEDAPSGTLGYYFEANHPAYVDGVKHLFHPKAVSGGSVVDGYTPYAENVQAIALMSYRHFYDNVGDYSTSIYTEDYNMCGGYDNWNHDWTYAAETDGRLPVHLHRIAEVSRTDEAQLQTYFKNSVTALNFYAVYPFVINTTDGGYTPNTSVAANADNADNGDKIVSFPVKATLGTENYSFDTTGVTDVMADTDDADARYYNLQGISVSRDEMVPGVYIRRTGTTATKVIVR